VPEPVPGADAGSIISPIRLAAALDDGKGLNAEEDTGDCGPMLLGDPTKEELWILDEGIDGGPITGEEGVDGEPGTLTDVVDGELGTLVDVVEEETGPVAETIERVPKLTGDPVGIEP